MADVILLHTKRVSRDHNAFQGAVLRWIEREEELRQTISAFSRAGEFGKARAAAQEYIRFLEWWIPTEGGA